MALDGHEMQDGADSGTYYYLKGHRKWHCQQSYRERKVDAATK